MGRRRSLRIRGRGSAGQTTVLFAAVLGIGVLLAVGIARVGAAAVDRARARTAADAAALAAAVDGPAAAAGRAADNGGEVVAVGWIDGQVEVTVRVGRAQATARAVAVPRVSRPTQVVPYTLGDGHDRAAAQSFPGR